MYKEVLFTIMVVAVVAMDAAMVNVAVRCMKEITRHVLDKISTETEEQ